jgi:hypothetical protein
MQEIQAVYPSFGNYPGPAVWKLYRDGYSATDGRRIWAHAEDFLDYLDTAAVNKTGAAAKWLHEHIKPYGHNPSQGKTEFTTIDRFRAMARQIMAAETSIFTRDADVKTEKWSPYRKWGSQLSADDTIVTFNYDLVAEMSSERVEPYFGGALPADAPVLLKLHGSVDWRRRPEGGGFERAGRDHAATCSNDDVCMGTPGPSKSAMCQELAALWDAAVRAIRSADAIVFVGYRFAPGDAQARETLLEAIAGMQQRHVSLHIVLGPPAGTSAGDIVRLESMLKHTADRTRAVNGYGPRKPEGMHTADVKVWPLYAEDFLSVVGRDAL